MSNNKLKAKTLNKINLLQSNLEGLVKGVQNWNKEDFEPTKTNLINQLKQLHIISLELEVDVVDLMLNK
jgi:hypothetical protein